MHGDYIVVKIFEILHEQPVLFLFLLIGIGMAFGKIKIKGIGLGAAAVLFFAIVMAAWAQSFGIELQVTKQLGTLGLTLFTFAIGINSGASFFHNLKTAVGPILMMVAFYGIAATLGLYVGKAMGMEVPLIAGTFAGAVTNTPALAAAGEASGDTPAASPRFLLPISRTTNRLHGGHPRPKPEGHRRIYRVTGQAYNRRSQ